MIKKLIFSSLICLCLMPSARAAEKLGGFALWEGSEKYTLQKATIKITMPHMVGMVAVRKVANGGYFCPVDFACETQDTSGMNNVWISTYYPDEEHRDKCVWLCTKGFTGVECNTPDTGDSALCDTNNLKEWLSGVSGGRSTKREDVVYEKLESKPSKYKVTGLIALDEHSAMMRDITIGCQKRKYNSRYNTEFAGWYAVEDADEQLVCAQGYKVDGDKCIPIGQTCMAMSGNFCSDYPESGYDSSVHTLQMNDVSKCVEYRCIGSNMGFPTTGGYTCAACGTLGDPRVGVDSGGRCLVCQTGEYFGGSQNENQCVAINTKYTRTDLVYGSGKTKASETNVSYQCWPENSPDDYSMCVATPDNYKIAKNKK